MSRKNRNNPFEHEDNIPKKKETNKIQNKDVMRPTLTYSIKPRLIATKKTFYKITDIQTNFKKIHV